MFITNLLKISCIFSCIALSACQSTSIRDLSADEANNAKQGFEQPTKQKSSDFEPPQASQLRMYVFTGFEHEGDKENGRDGYFIDFSISDAKTQQQ